MRLLGIFTCLTILSATNLFTFNSESRASASTLTTSFTADIWADNWFVMYVNGVKIAQDPVPITTTKSFNKVSISFSARYPLTIALMARDYTENKSGLEYIGTPQQQIGDAGLIAQIHERASGKLVAATSGAWKAYVVNRAPLNPDCVTSTNPIVDCKSLTKSTPKDWGAATFKSAGWSAAIEYSEQAVGVKDGYNEVEWDPRSRLIWSGSLTLDNTVLFRTVAKTALANTTVFGLNSSSLSSGNGMNASNTCDGIGVMPNLEWSGTPSGARSLLLTLDTVPGPVRPGETAQIDFNHLVHYNLNPKVTSISAALNVGTKGKNFKGSLGYTPPCSQGPGEKAYTFHLYALSIELIGSGLTGAQALSQATGHVLNEAKLTVYYSRN